MNDNKISALMARVKKLTPDEQERALDYIIGAVLLPALRSDDADAVDVIASTLWLHCPQDCGRISLQATRLARALAARERRERRG